MPRYEITDIKFMVNVTDAANDSGGQFDVHDVSNSSFTTFDSYWNAMNSTTVIGNRTGKIGTGWQNLLSSVDLSFLFKHHPYNRIILGIKENGDNNDEMYIAGDGTDLGVAFEPYLEIKYFEKPNYTINATETLAHFTVDSGPTMNLEGTTFIWPELTSHTVTMDEIVVLPNNTEERSVFSRWLDNSDTNRSRSFSVPAFIPANSGNRSFTAIYKTQYRLQTGIDMSNAGSIAFDKAGTADSIGRWYDGSTKVTLTVTENAGYRFAGWSGDCSGNAKTITVTLDKGKSCTADFYQLITLASSPAAKKITVRNIATDVKTDYTTQTTVPLRAGKYEFIAATPIYATMSEGHVFKSWSTGAVANKISISIPSATTTYTASYNPLHLLEINNLPAEGGYVKAYHCPDGKNIDLSKPIGGSFVFSGAIADYWIEENPVSNLYISLKAFTYPGNKFVRFENEVATAVNPTPCFQFKRAFFVNAVFNSTASNTITGYVKTTGGLGKAGVTFTGATCNATNSSGFYSCSVASGWNGTITPVLTGATFTPASMSYSNVSADQIDQDYSAALPQDTTSPSLTITSPSNNQKVVVSTITIEGTASDSGKGDNGIQQITVNGTRATGDTATLNNTANWSKTVTLTPGVNTITIVAFDNYTVPNTTSKTITITYDGTDITPPTGSITINNGAQYANSTAATLTFTSSDTSGPIEMCISNTSVCSSYQPYVTPKAWTLPATDGTKTVNLWLRDSLGNATTAPLKDSIILDRAQPIDGTFSATPGPGKVTLNWSGFSDALSGVGSYKIMFSKTATPSSSCTSGTQICKTALANCSHNNLAVGTYYYRVCAVDKAGNVSAGKPVTAIVVTTIPSAISLPETGQKTCYDAAGAVIACAGTGQDGELQAGVAWLNPRFVSGTGAEADCMIDTLTGLMWPKNGNLANGTKTWQEALTYSNDLNYCGYTDWRLPDRKELFSLINWEESNPATWLNTQGFNNVQSDYYWSSSTIAYYPDYAWLVYMWYGNVYGYSKSSSGYVWPVRAGQSGSFGSFSVELPKTGQTTCYDSGGAVIACAGTGQDGELQTGIAWPNPRFVPGIGAEANCMIDKLTGLMWPKNGNLAGTTKTWQEALTYSNDLNYCGHTDWRLPNVNELESLVNLEESDVAAWLNLPAQGFNNVQSSDYWSSSTIAYNPGYAWRVFMWSGFVGDFNKAYSSYVWPVRAGQ